MNLLDGFTLGLVIAMITTPVGGSGAVFLLPAQLSLLNAPSPAVTPTNMLFNVVAVPGALAHYGWRDAISSRLARHLLVGTVPGVVIAGYTVADVAPAAFLSTFVTSCVGAVAYAALDLTGQTRAAPRWTLGIACGLGGLVGGYIGAGLQSRVPRDGLRRVLGALAAALAVAYLAQVTHG
jgi:uncharacterized protein